MFSAYKIIPLVALFTMFFVQSCIKDDTPPEPPGRCGVLYDTLHIAGSCPLAHDSLCTTWQHAIGIASITGNAVSPVGQPVHLSVAATGTNGCALVAVIRGSQSGNTITLTADIKYAGCSCTAALQNVIALYSFTPTHPGVYHVQGFTWDSTLVVKTITVQ